MKTHKHVQGSPEWHAHRAQCFNASDASAMLGCSPYKTRAALLREYATTVRPEADASTQRLFDDGHRFEALAQPRAEDKIGEALGRVVGSEDFGLSRPLGASFDGLTMLGDTGWEHKTLNDDLRACMKDEGNGYDLPKHYRAQMEQQLLVSGAERILFMATKWTPSGELVEERFCWYASDPKLRAEILAGWRQFDADLAAYVPAEPVAPAAAAPIDALPAVSVRMDGAIAVHSNLDAFGAKLREFIGRIPAKPASDQEFADCDAACKALKRAEEALDGAEANALGQVQTVEALTRTIADLRNVARTARLASEKVVKARKEQIRVEEVQRGQKALADFIAGLNGTIGKPYMPSVPADFAAAISGKKTLESLRNAIDTELARAKISANDVCGRIVINLRTLRENAANHAFLFADTAQLVLKDEDAVRAIVTARIAEHQAEEQRRAEAAAERERERIRQEEAARLRREQEEQARQAAAAELAAAKAKPEGAELSAGAQAMNEQEGAARFAATHRSIAPAANAPVVVPIQRGKPSLRLGQINERIAPLQITAAGLESLGFKAAGKEGAAVLFHEADFPAMVDSMVTSLRTAQQKMLQFA